MANLTIRHVFDDGLASGGIKADPIGGTGFYTGPATDAAVDITDTHCLLPYSLWENL